MRVIKFITFFSSIIFSAQTFAETTNQDDPYESFNRRTFKFNQAFDATFLKPPAMLYKNVIPAPVRSGINNFFNNINMIPTVGNDLLQGEWRYALKDTWRFIMNSTLGLGGILDPAEKASLPPHSNDLGLTFAKWGDRHSPYLIIPFLGPSTFRDGMGLMFNYFMTPYPYINPSVAYPLIAVRYVDLRSQMFDTEKLMAEAIDKYSFMRDAYLQHRNYLITGESPNKTNEKGETILQEDAGSLYVDDGNATSNELDSVLPQIPFEPENGTPSEFPLTTAHNASHRSPSA